MKDSEKSGLLSLASFVGSGLAIYGRQIRISFFLMVLGAVALIIFVKFRDEGH